MKLFLREGIREIKEIANVAAKKTSNEIKQLTNDNSNSIIINKSFIQEAF